MNPIRIRPRHLRLDPDRRGRPRGQRRRRSSGCWTTCPDSDVVVFPELCVTGYTCADLFGQSALLDGRRRGPRCRIAEATAGRAQLVVVGLPVPVGNSLFNCGVAIADGAVLGIVPKQFIPNYKEFYESRWFSSADGPRAEGDRLRRPARSRSGSTCCSSAERRTPWSSGSRSARTSGCRSRPARSQAIAGATILLNLSASNETIGKSRYRTDLVVGQSGRCIAAYAYAGARADASRRPTWSSAATA